MPKRPFRMQLILLITALLLCLVNCRHIFANEQVRSVDILSLVALGMTIGALITSLAYSAKQRRWNAANGK